MSSTNFIPMLSSSPPAMGDSFDDSWTHGNDEDDDDFGDFGKFSPPKHNVIDSTHLSHNADPFHKAPGPEKETGFANFGAFDNVDSSTTSVSESWAAFDSESSKNLGDTNHNHEDDFGDFDSFVPATTVISEHSKTPNDTSATESAEFKEDSMTNSDSLPRVENDNPVHLSVESPSSDSEVADIEDVSPTVYPTFIKHGGYSSASDSPIHFKEPDYLDSDSTDALDEIYDDSAAAASKTMAATDDSDPTGAQTFQTSDSVLTPDLHVNNSETNANENNIPSDNDQIPQLDSDSKNSATESAGGISDDLNFPEIHEEKDSINTENSANGNTNVILPEPEASSEDFDKENKEDISSSENCPNDQTCAATNEQCLPDDAENVSAVDDTCQLELQESSAVDQGTVREVSISTQSVSDEPSFVTKSEDAVVGTEENVEQEIESCVLTNNEDRFGNFSSAESGVDGQQEIFVGVTPDNNDTINDESIENVDSQENVGVQAESDGDDDFGDFGDFRSNIEDSANDKTGSDGKGDIEEFGTFSSVDKTATDREQSNSFAAFNDQNTPQNLNNSGEEDDEFGNFNNVESTQSNKENEFGEFNTTTDDDWAGFGSAKTSEGTGGWASFQAPSDNDAGDFGKFETNDNDNEDDESTAFVDHDQDEFGDFGNFEKNHSSSVNDDDDDFGGFEESGANENFGDFSKTQTQIKHSIPKQSGLSKVEQLIGTCFTPSSDLADELDDNCLLTLLEITEKQDHKTCYRWLPLWSDLCDIDHTIALKYTWHQSKNKHKLLNSLHVDTRNLLVGHKKPSVPIFATGLGLLQPTKGSQDDKVAPQLIDTSKKEETKEENLPPVEFDWSSSGLTNPLDSSQRNALLDLDFFSNTDSHSQLQSKPSELETEFLSSVTVPSASSGKTLQPLESLLSKFTPTMSTIPKTSKDKSSLSDEASRIVSRFPNLSFMKSKVLMFPLKTDAD